jgi:hypothetical protein
MALEFLQPVSVEISNFLDTLSNQCLGKKIAVHTETEFPDLKQISLAIITVNEDRGAKFENKEEKFDNFRKQFYQLYPGNWKNNIADLGHLEAGENISDTYFAIREIASTLIKQKITPIIIGGSQDLTYAMYRAYDKLEQMVNVVAIDNQFDFHQEEKLASDSYLSSIIIEEPNNLNNFSNIGYQTYYNPQEEIDLIEKMYFDAYRLGEIINNPTHIEPVFRDADLVSLDLKSMKSSESGNPNDILPNGFNSREICLLSRYAGISDKVSSFGIFNHYNTMLETHLIAQIIWYFIEGYHFRSYEYPFEDKKDYFKYTVLIEDDELVFFKSNRSERWWIEIESKHNNKLKRTLLPCTKEDYQAATQQNIPERWWKAQKRC